MATGKENVHISVHRSVKVEDDPALAEMRFEDGRGEPFQPTYVREYITYYLKRKITTPQITNYHVGVGGSSQMWKDEHGRLRDNPRAVSYSNSQTNDLPVEDIPDEVAAHLLGPEGLMGLMDPERPYLPPSYPSDFKDRQRKGG